MVSDHFGVQELSSRVPVTPFYPLLVTYCSIMSWYWRKRERFRS